MLTTFIIITEKQSLLIIDKIIILKWRKIAIYLLVICVTTVLRGPPMARH